MHSVHIIGVPLDLGAGRRGVDMGPSAIRLTGLGDKLTALGLRVSARGDIPTPVPETKAPRDVRKKYVRHIAKACRRLHDTALSSLEAGALPLVLGGDHSLAAGSVAASSTWAKRARNRPIGLLWIDAHGDMNTPASSPSGNVHGMPLAALLGAEPYELATIGDHAPKAIPEHTVLLGVRNLDDREKTAVRESGIHVFTMKDIDRQGIATVVEQAVKIAAEGTAGIHVSLDMDVCDPSIAPGVGTPVKGGLNYREAHMVMEIVADSERLTSLDIVEVNPALDHCNQTAELGCELALSALGMKIL